MGFIKIAHRGHLTGPNPEQENNPDYVEEAMKNGFRVEIDVWLSDGVLFLGHDEPTYEIDHKFLTNGKLWCHAKNVEALLYMLGDDYIHCFWHETDKVTLTSRGFVWTYPGITPLSKKSIAVLPELVVTWDYTKCFGVCSDYIAEFDERGVIL